jgi:hypothetical protein
MEKGNPFLIPPPPLNFPCMEEIGNREMGKDEYYRRETEKRFYCSEVPCLPHYYSPIYMCTIFQAKQH